MASTQQPLQTVTGTVTETPEGVVVRTGPIELGPDGARAEVIFDREVRIPLSALIPDPERRSELERGIEALLSSESDRFDDLCAAGGLDPAVDLAGSSLAGIEFGGTADRPMDIRGWDLSGCDFTGSTLAHLVMDGTTNLAGATLDDISGSAAGKFSALAAAQAAPTP